jgi:phenylacetate-CoA ligase
MDLKERLTGVRSHLETLDAATRADHAWRRLAALAASAWEKSGEFRARMERTGLGLSDLRSLEDWPRIPVLRKKDLLALQKSGPRLGGLLACGFGELSRIYQSPGPIYDPEGRSRDYWGWTDGFFAAGFRPGDLVQMTFSYHLTPAGLMLEEPLREIGCAVIPAGPGNTEVQIELLTQLPVTGFVGMASYLRIIADKARAQGLDLKKDFNLQVAFVAAERLPESLRRGLEQDFGMVVRQGYGTADLGCIAYECAHLGGMHTAERCYVEICDPATGAPLPLGEAGEVVVTPYSDTYPLVRFATGDLSRFTPEPCACGRTSFKLAGILGRVDDTAKVKGQFIYPAQAAEVCARFPAIRRFQIVVENPGGKDSLALVLETCGDLDQDAFVRAFQDRLKLRPTLRVLPAGDCLPEGAKALVDNRTFE